MNDVRPTLWIAILVGAFGCTDSLGALAAADATSPLPPFLPDPVQCGPGRCEEFGDCCSCQRIPGLCTSCREADIAQSISCHYEGCCAGLPYEPLNEVTQCSGELLLVGTPQGCQASQVCKRFGWCGPETYPDYVRKPKATSYKYTLCCSATAAGCKKAWSCTKYGKCTASAAEGLCLAATDADCAASVICAQDGQCQADGKTCCVDRTDKKTCRWYSASE